MSGDRGLAPRSPPVTLMGKHTQKEDQMADETSNSQADEKIAPGAARTGGGRTLNWDDSDMTTTYANVVNVAMTREECGLFFGTNLTSNISTGDQVTIRLTDRIIMTPHAAKRLAMLLQANLRGYEERYGKLEVAPE
ncbi:MAG: DUF3467 domain-containing protein [Halieaceae bacterium]|jgi:hypothetical protein|nr:DUF3467 domain-containing protein [Halieaceae bacterium]